MEILTINGEEYVKKSSIDEQVIMAQPIDDMPYVICRTYSAGVFAGYIKSREGQEVELINARRLWYWEGAASLSQLACDGVSKPTKCKFPKEVPSIILLQVIEIMPVSAVAKKSIAAVKEWSA